MGTLPSGLYITNSLASLPYSTEGQLRLLFILQMSKQGKDIFGTKNRYEHGHNGESDEGNDQTGLPNRRPRSELGVSGRVSSFGGKQQEV